MKENKKDSHKKHICIFCKKEVARAYKHFLSRHKNEDKVRDAVSETDKRLRYWKWKKLKQEGDNFANNQLDNLMEKRLVKERNKKGTKKKKYFDCPKCQGRILKTSKLKHQLKCKKMLGVAPITEETSVDIFRDIPENVINTIRKSLYLTTFFHSMANEQEKLEKKPIRTAMTDLIDLESKLVKSSNKPLVSFLAPQYVSTIIQSIKALCQETFDGRDKIFKFPSKGLRLCRLLKKLGEFLKKYFTYRDMDSDILVITKFLSIFEEESEKFIKRIAERTIKLKKLKNPPVLPRTQDINVLIKTLESKTCDLISNLEQKKSINAWRELADNVLCRLTIFNRRRGGAVEKMKVSDYTSARFNSRNDITEEALFNLTKEDQKFLENIKIVDIIHKCDNVVEIFIPSDIQKAMDVLLTYRGDVNINEKNEYFFAASKHSVNPISGVGAMAKCRECLPKHVQSLFTATNLRKHGATLAQFLNLSQTDTEALANHLGHSVDVHKRYYRCREKSIAVLKTGRFFTALNRGDIKYYKGKSIEEIPFQPNEDNINSNHLLATKKTESEPTEMYKENNSSPTTVETMLC